MSTGVTLSVRVPLSIRRRPGRKTIVLSGAAGLTRTPAQADPTLLKALARAHRWQRMLDEGRYASISEMAAAERIERGFLGKMLRLTLLAPDAVEAILDGRQLTVSNLAELLEPFPLEWNEQTAKLLG